MLWMPSPLTKPFISNSFYYPRPMSRFLSIIRPMAVAALLAAAPLAQAQVGQPGRPGGRLTQIENAKIAFITNRISLTQEQAQKFWPIYNEFSARRRELNRNTRLLRRDITPDMSDQQIRDNITQSFTGRQQELNLEKEYFEKFQKVISLRQVAQLLNAERDFTKEVIKRVADRRGVGAAGGAIGLDD